MLVLGAQELGLSCSIRLATASGVPWPPTMVVYASVTVTLAARPSRLQAYAGQAAARVGGDHIAAHRPRQVAQLGDAPVTETGRPDHDRGKVSCGPCWHQHAERRAVDVLGDDQQRPPDRMTCSSTGMSSWTLEIFSLVSRTYGLSSRLSIRSRSVTMYGDM